METLAAAWSGFSLRQQPLRLAFLGIVILELLSFFGWAVPVLGNVVMLAILAIVLVLSLADLRTGVAVMVAELCIGSHGYLFAFINDGLSVSLRIGLFLVVCSVAVLRAIQARQLEFWKSSLRWPLFALMLAVALAALRGWQTGNGFANVFFDANAFMFLAAVIPFWQALRSPDDLLYVAKFAFVAVIANTTKVLLMIYMFSHDLWWALPETYRWIRDTRIGELTEVTDTFFRIFFQSQIYAAFALCVVTVYLVWRWSGKTWRQALSDRSIRASTGVLTLLLASTLVSLSRSNWLGLTVAFLVLPVLLTIARLPVLSWTLRAYASVVVATVGSLVLIAALLLVPIPPNNGWFSASMFGNRAFDKEAGVGSRWALIGPLWTAIKAQPLIGKGFGTEVTYKTQDPRLLAQNPSGIYTTFIFEWGYHDLWLKLGLIGLIVYGVFILTLLRRGIQSLRNSPLDGQKVFLLGMTMALLALLTTHTTSPYLNHPLGISFLLLYGITIDLFDRKVRRS